MESYTPRPIVFRNNRFLIVIVLIGSAVSVFLAACMLLMALSMFFPWHGYTFDRANRALGWLLGTVSCLFMAQWLWRLGHLMAHYEARLDDKGVDFSLGTKRSPKELFFAWDDIAAVKRQKTGRVQNYIVVGSDESYVKFTSYNFFRPEKLAHVIAARARLAIQDM